MTEPSTRSTPAPAASAGPSPRTARSRERAAWWGTIFYVGDLKTTQTFGFRASDGKVVFASRDGAYNPVIADGQKLYMTGYRVIYALKPAKGRSENGFVVRGKKKARVAA